MELEDITNTTRAMQLTMTASTRDDPTKPSTVLRRSQLQFLHVFKFAMRRRRRFGTVLLERRDGVDGVDFLKLNKEWSISGRERVFSVTVPRERSRLRTLPWQQYEVYTMTSDFVPGRHNLALATLTAEDPIYMSIEIIVTKKGAEKGRFVNMGVMERKTAEMITIS
uniref:Protein kinase domain-containing protein n=1 Tax=Ganoderma boninense TaxID=34458 RepID=A0A5K1JXM3_9APHY|nr:Protein kinase domain-containing protein [Ganoderma boninense]